MSGEYKVARLCETLAVSRSGYYQWRRGREQPGRRQAETLQLKQRIREAFAQSRETYGSPRVAQALGCPGRHNRIARLMREEEIRARQRSKFRVATTDSRHGGPIAPNRLLGFKADRPDQAWVMDATCVPTGQGWLYLVAVLDIFSRRVLGWAMSAHLDAKVAVDALHMALSRRSIAPGLIVHSDRGMQFASAAFREVLADHGLVASMSRKGNCYDNAYIESFWSSLKHEAVWHRRFTTRDEARTALFDYIESFYNRTRLHSSLGYLSPINFESHLN
jgi:putative transposase